MKRRFTAPFRAQLLVRTRGNSRQLRRTNKFIEREEVLFVGDMEEVVYDHNDKLAISFVHEKRRYFILVEDIEPFIIRDLALRWTHEPENRLQIYQLLEDHLAKHIGASLQLVQ